MKERSVSIGNGDSDLRLVLLVGEYMGELLLLRVVQQVAVAEVLNLAPDAVRVDLMRGNRMEKKESKLS